MPKQQLINGFPVESRKIADLVKAPYNPRKISDEQRASLKRSLEEFGTVEPIIVNKTTGNVVGGHQRLDALMASGETQTDVIIVEMDADREKALNLALNKISGEWDDQKLRDLFNDLGGGELDLTLTGFSQEEIDGLLGIQNEGLTDADEVPEKVETRCKSGDIWQLGEHRLMCGDSTDAGSVALLMNGMKADMVFTDPPYGVAIGAKNRMLNSFQKAGRNLTDIESDQCTPEELKAKLLPAFVNIRNVMSDDCTVFVTAPQGGELGMMMMMMQEAGLRARHVLIWKKNAPTFSMGRLDYEYQHEPILLTWGKRHKWYGKGEHKTSVWEIAKPRSSASHPTMKPVELVFNALLNNSKAGDVCIDFYLGSGTTLIACEQLNRKCYGMEIDEHYCDVIIERWQNFTGKEAVKL
jgi:DNA modification methylase